jgi:hypothetical protein
MTPRQDVSAHTNCLIRLIVKEQHRAGPPRSEEAHYTLLLSVVNSALYPRKINYLLSFQTGGHDSPARPFDAGKAVGYAVRRRPGGSAPRCRARSPRRARLLTRPSARG